MSVLKNVGQTLRTIGEINVETTRKLVELQVDSVRRVFTAQRELGKAIVGVRSFESFTEAQKTYASAIRETIENDFRTRVETTREAFKRTGSALRGTFASVDEAPAAVEA